MKLILFDFDGVLVDTLSICFTLHKEIDDSFSIEEYQSLFHLNIHEAVKSGKMSKSSRPDYFEQYEKRTRELKIPVELKEIVQNIYLDNILAIVSSTPGSSIQSILRRESLDAYFKDVLGSDVHTSKVLKIKMLLDKYKTAPEHAIFITDTVGDIMEARECGVKSIAVTWGFQEKETLLKAKPEKIADTPEELLKAIKGI